MDIHKPKPWHGVREFLKEYLIIVVGVLTALAAEQAVEWLHWQHEIHVAREAVAFDLRRVLGEAAAKDAISPCVARVFAGYADALEEAQVTKRLPAVGWAGSPGSSAWTLRSWYGLTSGQTLAHMSNKDQIALSALAGYLEYARSLRSAEGYDLGMLNGIMGPSRPTSDAEIANLKAALGRATENAAQQRSLGRQLETMILRSGFLDKAQAKAAFQEGATLARTVPLCRGTAAPIAHARDMIERGLGGPPRALGETKVYNPGVGNALTTEK